MITILKMLGFCIFILVGFHYINESVGLSVAESIAITIFGVCLTQLFPEYRNNGGTWIGWSLIVLGCFLIAMSTSLSWFISIPVMLIIIGYKLAGLPFNLSSPSSYTDLGGAFFGDSDGGGCGGGDGGCE